MSIHSLPKFNIAYGLPPSKRNQDVIRIDEYEGGGFSVAVVDGWNNLDYLPNNVSGRRVAEFVAREFPKMFFMIKRKSLVKRAEQTAASIDREVISMYPAHVSCVGSFLFMFSRKIVIVSVGNRAIGVLLWNGYEWYKPNEIGDYTIEYPKYPSEVSRFFGRGELKKDPMYLAKPDVVICSQSTPLLLATDGLEDVLSLKDINAIVQNPHRQSPRVIVETLLKEIRKRKTQKDDILILVKL